MYEKCNENVKNVMKMSNLALVLLFVRSEVECGERSIAQNQGCCLRKFGLLTSKVRSPKPLFWEPRINLTWSMGGGGGWLGRLGRLGKTVGEGGLNCGNIGEGSWVRDFP